MSVNLESSGQESELFADVS